jgi:hypothetical protein
MSDPSPPAVARLARLGPPFLGLVAIEFLLGMSLNLFVTLPSGSPEHILAASPVLDVHLLFGVLLLGIAANAVHLAAAARTRPAVLVTVLGLLSGLAAFGAGLSFAFGDQSAGASYAMSVGFVGLLLEAGYLLHIRSTLPALGGSPTAPSAPGAAP